MSQKQTAALPTAIQKTCSTLQLVLRASELHQLQIRLQIHMQLIDCEQTLRLHSIGCSAQRQ